MFHSLIKLNTLATFCIMFCWFESYKLITQLLSSYVSLASSYDTYSNHLIDISTMG